MKITDTVTKETLTGINLKKNVEQRTKKKWINCSLMPVLINNYYLIDFLIS
jgi:hypothetical protein